MRKSRVFPRSRTYKIQAARATKQKQEEAIPPPSSGECPGTDKNRRSNPAGVWRAVEVVPARGHCGDSRDVACKISRGVTNAPPTDKNKEEEAGQSCDAAKDHGGLQNSGNSAEDCRILSGTSGREADPGPNPDETVAPLDVENKPPVNYNALLYKNFPKQVAGIKVTKKFLLMSKGLDWKSLNSEADKNQLASSDGQAAPPTPTSPKVPQCQPHDRAPSCTATEQLPAPPVIDDDVKPEFKIVKLKRSNLKKVISARAPKSHIRWHPNKTVYPGNNAVECNSEGTCPTTFVEECHPANVANHNSTQSFKNGLWSLEPGKISTQAHQLRNFALRNTNVGSQHRMKMKAQLVRADDSHPMASLETQNIRKTRHHSKSFGEQACVNHVPSRIPVFVKKDVKPSQGFRGNYKSDVSAQIQAPDSNRLPFNFHKSIQKPPRSTQVVNFPEEKKAVSTDWRSHPYETSSRTYDTVGGMQSPVTNNFCINGVVVKEPEGVRSNAVKNSFVIKRSDLHQPADKYLKSSEASCSDDEAKSPTYISKREGHHDQHRAKLQFEVEKAHAVTPESNLDENVRELQNLIDHHKNQSAVVVVSDATDADKIQDNIAKMNSIKEMKVLRTLYPFQSQEDKDSSVTSTQEAGKPSRKPSGEARSDAAPVPIKSPRYENSKKELNRVIKILLKRQDAELKNNLLRYLMEEMEKNKQKVPNGLLTREKSRPALKTERRKSNSRSASPNKRRNRDKSGSKSHAVHARSRVNSASSRVAPVDEERPSSRSQKKNALRELLSSYSHCESSNNSSSKKINTYKSLYGCHEELICETPKSIRNRSLVGAFLGDQDDLVEEYPRFKKCPVIPTAREKPFRSWLKSNNMIADESPKPVLRSEHCSIIGDPPTAYNNNMEGEVDISHLFSTDGGYGGHVYQQRPEVEYDRLNASPPDYFFRSPSMTGVNNNNIKPPPGGAPIQAYCSTPPKLSQTQLAQERFDSMPCPRASLAARSGNDSDGGSQVSQSYLLNRRLTKKPIKMSVLPCPWSPKAESQQSCGSTLRFDCPSSYVSSVCSGSGGQKRCRPVKKDSFGLISPETVRSQSFSSDKSSPSLRLVRNGRPRILFHQ